MTKEETVVKGLSTKALVIGIVLCGITAFMAGAHNNAIISPINYYWSQGSGHIWDRSGGGPLMVSLGYAVFMALILGIINKMKPVFTKQEVTIILLMLIAGNFIGGWSDMAAGGQTAIHFLGVAMGLYIGGFYTTERANAFYEALPPFLTLGQDVDYWQATYYTVAGSGWDAINWGYVLPGTLWLSVLVASLAVAVIMLIVMLRRIYVEIEALQFPLGQIENELVNFTSKGPNNLLRNKLFLISFTLVFLYWMAQSVPLTWYGIFVDHYWDNAILDSLGVTKAGIRWNYLGLWDLTPYALLPWAVMFFSLDPWAIGWGIMLPTDVLQGFLVSSIFLYVLLGPILTGAGILPPMNTGYKIWDWGVVERLSHMSDMFPTLNYMSLTVGLVLGMAIVPLVRNRGTIIPILKSLIAEPPQEIDPRRPVPHRVAAIIFVVSLLVSFGAAAAANVQIVPWIVLIVLVLVMMVGALRITAETGGAYGVLLGDRNNFAVFNFMASIVILMFAPAILSTREANVSNVMTLWTIFGIMAICMNVLQSGILTQNFFKVGQLNKTNLKDILKAALISVSISIFMYNLGQVVWFIIFPSFGTGVWWTNIQKAEVFEGVIRNLQAGELFYWWDYEGIQGFSNLLTFHGVDSLIKIILGFAVVPIIGLLRNRFPWFRISAAGFTLGVMWGPWMWAAMLISYVVKTITLKVGGEQLYREKLRPIAMGLYLGFFLAFLLGWLWGAWAGSIWNLYTNQWPPT